VQTSQEIVKNTQEHVLELSYWLKSVLEYDCRANYSYYTRSHTHWQFILLEKAQPQERLKNSYTTSRRLKNQSRILTQIYLSLADGIELFLTWWFWVEALMGVCRPDDGFSI
jgi:hypothetical protein